MEPSTTAAQPQYSAAPPAAAPPSAKDRVAAASRAVSALLDELERTVVGKRPQLSLILSGLIANGNVLLDDVPGVAKTLTARTLAAAGGMTFNRVQFTPDVLPSDITGVTALDLSTHEPVFKPGPIFAQLVLADEINRAPAKTQAAMLEAMQEKRITVDGTTHILPRPFMVIATQNPVDSEGTYPLPEAQLDRFILRTTIGYPDLDAELELLRRRLARRADEGEVNQVLGPNGFAELIATVEDVQVHPLMLDYITAITRATRDTGELQLGSSPRGSLAVLQVGRAMAMMAGRDFVTPDDVRAVAVACLAHRVILTDEAWARRVDPATVISQVINSVPAPTWQ